MSRTLRVLAAVPTPPPFSGPEMNGAQLIAGGLGDGAELMHVRTNVHASNADKGRVTLTSLGRLATMWWKTLYVLLTRRPHVFYLFLSQNRTGFLRDTVLIATARGCGVPVVAHIKGGNMRAFRATSSPWLAALVRRVLGALAVVCVEGERLRDGVSDVVPADRVLVVPNIVDLELPVRGPGGDASCTLLFMGHLSVAKGFGDLLDALPRALDACPELRVECAGAWLLDERNIHAIDAGRATAAAQRDLPSQWADLQTRYGARVRLLGVVEGRARLDAFGRADLLALPSHSEGLPMAVLEAMSCGIPVLVTPVGAVPEFVSDGVNGRIVAVGDVDALSQALVAMASDATERRRMGDAAALAVRHRCSPEAGRAAMRRVFEIAAATSVSSPTSPQ